MHVCTRAGIDQRAMYFPLVQRGWSFSYGFVSFLENLYKLQKESNAYIMKDQCERGVR